MPEDPCLESFWGHHYNANEHLNHATVLTSINNLSLRWMLPKLRLKLGLLSSEYTEELFHEQIECTNPLLAS